MKTPIQSSHRKPLELISRVVLGGLLVFLVQGVLVGCGGESELATVDGETITIEEFNEYLASKRTVRARIQGQVVEVQVDATLGFQALQELTTRKLVLHMAADEGVKLGKKEIDAEIKFRTALNPNYVGNLRDLGYTMGQIKDEVRYSLAEEGLLTRGIKVGDAELEKWIKDHPEQLEQPAVAEVYQVFVLTQAAKDEVDQALNSAQAFKSVANRFNQAPEGHHLNLTINRLTEPIKSIIEDAPIAATTEWVETAGGHKRFYVEKRTEATKIVMTSDLKESIRRQIALSYGRQANDLSVELVKRLKSSDVVISGDYEMLKATWDEFEDRIEDALKSAEEKGAETG